MCSGRLAIGLDLTFYETIRRKPDGVVDSTFIFEYNSFCEAKVSLPDMSALQLPSELLMGKSIFGDDDDARGIPVNPVNWTIKMVFSLAFPIADDGIS